MKATDRTDIDRSTIILPIRWPYVNGFFDGSKVREFRTWWLPETTERVLMWPTGRLDNQLAGGVAGMWWVDSVVNGPVYNWLDPDGHLGWVSQAGNGLGAAELRAYARARPLVVYGARDVVRFPSIIPGPVFGLDRAPQAFAYAPADWRSVLAAEVLLAA